MKLLKLGGITFRFHWVFLLLLFLLAFYGYLGETLILFSLVLAHETVHMLIARAHGLEVGDVELFPFGGVARIEDVLELDPQVESNVALAGPLFNFVLVAISMVLYANLPGWQQNEMFLFFIRCNLVLGFFNLLPALPLDGGRILRARLCGSLGFQQATELAIRISQIMASLLLLLGFYLFYTGHFHLTLFVAAFFLYFAAAKERTVAMYSFIRSLGRKKKILYEQGVMPLTTLMALDEAPLKDVLRRFAMKKYHRIVVVNKDGRVLGEVMESDVVDTIVNKGIFASVTTALRKK
ncbi:site-2 protease family protein [Dethiobacter alkaliphilus]|uniref:Peptidase M50 n=1 Tax=Dethiobacter alkaliphilus AHT 1 TaxID=555088 RepID=C0GEV5_DETAL|nr:site-2 protease family protein [Dethiobacter alkaliphilus]EEG78137.1 peptidase M50 [Dethiobacter alkaliphilus AHT 1]